LNRSFQKYRGFLDVAVYYAIEDSAGALTMPLVIIMIVATIIPITINL
jgi:hypothetical protein